MSVVNDAVDHCRRPRRQSGISAYRVPPNVPQGIALTEGCFAMSMNGRAFHTTYLSLKLPNERIGLSAAEAQLQDAVTRRSAFVSEQRPMLAVALPDAPRPGEWTCTRLGIHRLRELEN